MQLLNLKYLNIFVLLDILILIPMSFGFFATINYSSLTGTFVQYIHGKLLVSGNSLMLQDRKLYLQEKWLIKTH